MWKKCDSKFILYNFDDENMELQYSMKLQHLTDDEQIWFDYDTSKARLNSFLGLCRMLNISWRYRIK